MNPYYRKINLEITTEDWRFLNYLSHRYVSRTESFVVDETRTFDQYKDFFLVKSDRDYKQNPFFEKCRQMFTPDAPHYSLDYLYRYSHISLIPGELIPHRDKRTAAINIPLITFDKPIRWYDDEHNVLCEYKYDTAVSLLNTKILHGVTDNTTPRIIFQIGGFGEDFETVLTRFTTGILS
jgi:hypothetical protein